MTYEGTPRPEDIIDDWIVRIADKPYDLKDVTSVTMSGSENKTYTSEDGLVYGEYEEWNAQVATLRTYPAGVFLVISFFSEYSDEFCTVPPGTYGMYSGDSWVSRVEGVEEVGGSDPIPDVTEFQDPTSGILGWLAGRAMRARRGRGYVRKEYIQFDGAKYVDTGVICTQDTRIEAEFMRDTTVAQYLYGAVSDDNKASVTAYLSTGSGNWRFGGAYASITVSTGIKYSVSFDKNQALFDGSTKKYSGTVGTFETPHTLMLGVNHTASGGIGANKFDGKVYSFRVYDGDNLVLDYVPAEQGGKDGFWDKVSKRFIPLEG